MMSSNISQITSTRKCEVLNPEVRLAACGWDAEHDLDCHEAEAVAVDGGRCPTVVIEESRDEFCGFTSGRRTKFVASPIQGDGRRGIVGRGHVDAREEHQRGFPL